MVTLELIISKIDKLIAKGEEIKLIFDSTFQLQGIRISAYDKDASQLLDDRIPRLYQLVVQDVLISTLTQKELSEIYTYLSNQLQQRAIEIQNIRKKRVLDYLIS